MSESLWAATAEELLKRTASPDPTPGGGSIAAVSGALGAGLVLMALRVTDDPALTEQVHRGERLLDAIAPAADGDVRDFETLMAAYRMPKDDPERASAIESSGVAATERPLDLAETLLEVIALADAVEPLVKRSIVSDVLAGRDLARGAAAAAIRTADINLASLERASSPAAPALRARREAILTALQENQA
ncbi:MAG: cyclodeaminase/cyclohydrolase family protein [Microbacterium sp.]